MLFEEKGQAFARPDFVRRRFDRRGGGPHRPCRGCIFCGGLPWRGGRVSPTGGASICGCCSNGSQAAKARRVLVQGVVPEKRSKPICLLLPPVHTGGASSGGGLPKPFRREVSG